MTRLKRSKIALSGGAGLLLVAANVAAPAMAHADDSPGPLTVKIVSQNGVVLDGAVFSGTVCSDDGSGNKDCQDLNDYNQGDRTIADGTSNNFLTEQIMMLTGDDSQRFTIKQASTVPNCSIASGPIVIKNSTSTNSTWDTASTSSGYSFDKNTGVITIINQCSGTPGFVLPKYTVKR